jgi:hypothetical protein
MTHRTHCALRLGDNICHLHFLRAAAREYPDRNFIHYCHLVYLPQLAEVVSDIPNLHLKDLETVSDGDGDHWTMKPHMLLRSVDAWKNAGGRWERDPHRNDYSNFMFRHFCDLSQRMGLTFVPPHNLLFDYPALAYHNFPKFDCLIVNSPPMSGQMPGYHAARMENLIGELSAKMACVTTARTRFCPCTQDKQMTVTQIGALSRFCKVIVMVSTGPSWSTFNVWSEKTCQFRLILIGEERVNISSAPCEHASNAEEARAVLRVRGIL